MKRWMLVLVFAVIGMQILAGCKAKGEVDDNGDDGASLKVDVDD